jgi:DNA-binding transcriptional regulator YdaS (Cro superfamily)
MKNLHPVDKAASLLLLSLEGLGKELGGITKGAVSQWKLDGRSVPEKHCTAIERLTHGQVTRQELRPDDYWLIWPDLPAPELVKQGELTTEAVGV